MGHFILTLIYFIIILGTVVLVHETGHFIFAKLAKIYVYEFAIGMGPKIFSYKKKGGETTYTLRAIPIGGFVQLAGEEVEDDKDIPNNRKLQAKSPIQRILTMFFGAGFNFIFAIVLLFFIAIIWGVPSYKPLVYDVTKDTPAYEAGLVKGDTIISVDKNKTSTNDDVAIYITLADKDKPVEFKILKSDGTTVIYDILPTKEEVDDTIKYTFGIQVSSDQVSRNFFEAVKYTFVKTGSLFKQMWITLSSLFTGKLSVSNLSGPVGIYSIVGQQSEEGLASVLYLVAFLSINVGFINLLPFPAFDGGRILFVIIEIIKGKPVNPKVENIVHSIGFILLMLLMLYVTFNDILRLF